MQKNRSSRTSKLIRRISNILIILGALFLVGIFFNSFWEEIKFRVNSLRGTKYVLDENKIFFQPSEIAQTKVIIPKNRDFTIVIPKINANAEIFANINPFNSQEFLPVLKKGVVHASGTSFPGQGSNIFLFAHSTDSFFNVSSYNAVFYLIGKLQEGDEIDIYYRDKLFKYYVFEKKVVSARAIEYLEPTKDEILTLQTCYPPGTSLGRLIVRAK